MVEIPITHESLYDTRDGIVGFEPQVDQGPHFALVDVEHLDDLPAEVQVEHARGLARTILAAKQQLEQLPNGIRAEALARSVRDASRDERVVAERDFLASSLPKSLVSEVVIGTHIGR